MRLSSYETTTLPLIIPPCTVQAYLKPCLSVFFVNFRPYAAVGRPEPSTPDEKRPVPAYLCPPCGSTAAPDTWNSTFCGPLEQNCGGAASGGVSAGSASHTTSSPENPWLRATASDFGNVTVWMLPVSWAKCQRTVSPLSTFSFFGNIPSRPHPSPSKPAYASHTTLPLAVL